MNIQFKNNIEVRTSGLIQWLTYGGLLEGLPTDKKNARILSRVVQRAKDYFHRSNVHLIEPEQVEIKLDRPYRFGKPMRLPNIICIADLDYYRPMKDESQHASSATLVWFQDAYCFPIEDEIIEKIATIDWAEISEDFEY